MLLDGHCPTGAYSYGPYCYKFVQKHANWSVANNSCGPKEHLASITSIGEEEFLANIIRARNNSALMNMWIGLNDIQKEGTFQWSDQAPIDFIYWNDGEPNNNRGEDCVELVNGQYWNDRKCKTSLPYICKSPTRKDTFCAYICMFVCGVAKQPLFTSYLCYSSSASSSCIYWG